MLNEKISEAIAKCRKKLDPLSFDKEIIVLIGWKKYAELVSEMDNHVKVYSLRPDGHRPVFKFEGCDIKFSHDDNEVKVQIRDRYTGLTKKSIKIK